jgi:hypothetical protein
MVIGDGGEPASSAGAVPAMLEDLEQLATGLALEERDDAVRELAQAAYAEVSLGERLHAAVGVQVRVRLEGDWEISGTVQRVGADFLALATVRPRKRSWIVRTAALRWIEGLPERARPAATLGVTARLGITSAIRRLLDRECVLYGTDAVTTTAIPVRIGADFVQVDVQTGRGTQDRVVPLATLAAVRCDL